MPAHPNPVPDRSAARGLRGVILLAGRVGRSAFGDGIARSSLDLPVGAGRSVLDTWIDQFRGIVRAFGLPGLDVCVAVDQGGPLPRIPPRSERPEIHIDVVRDPEEYRGTAGVVRDLTREYAAGDLVLVTVASLVLREPLARVLADLLEAGEGVSVCPFQGGEIAASFLLRAGRFADVPDVGFVDLKEQALRPVADAAPLTVVRRGADAVLPIRTLSEYVGALRILNAPDGDARAQAGPFDEIWRPVFSVVEPGAHVGAGGVVQDSVVLAGGVVEEGAAVVRSLVCPGGVVRRGRCVVDEVVAE